MNQLVKLSIPTIAQMASYTVLQFTDTLMLSRVSDDAAAASASGGMLSFAMISLGFGTVLMINTLASQAFGRKDNHECGQYMWQGIWYSILFGSLCLLLIPFRHQLFGALSSPALAPLQAQFFAITLSFVVVKLVVTSLEQFCLAINRPAIVAISTIVTVIANIALNYVLIFGKFGLPAMGIAGSAWGTNFSLLIGLLFLIPFVMGRDRRERFRTSDWRLDPKKFWTLIRIGLPAGLSMMSDVLAWSLFSLSVFTYFGDKSVAAVQYMFRYMMVGFMPAFGIGTAVTVLVGRSIGAGKIDAATKFAHLGFVLTATYMVLCGILLAALRHQLMQLFTHDQAVIQIGAVLLIFAAIYQFFDAMFVVYNSALRGAGDTLVPGLFMLISCWLLVVTGGWISAKYYPGFGVSGPWTLATIYGVILGVFLFVRFQRGRWKTIHLEPQ